MPASNGRVFGSLIFHRSSASSFGRFSGSVSQLICYDMAVVWLYLLFVLRAVRVGNACNIHAFRDCLWAKQVWHSIFVNLSDSFFTPSIDDWISSDVLDISRPHEHVIKFITRPWVIWCSRNKEVLQHETISLYGQYHWFLQLLDECKRAYLSDVTITSRSDRWVSWVAPITNYVKLNVDGSSMENPGAAGFTGLTRDNFGRWLVGFSGFIGHVTNMLAALQAMYHSLSLAWE